MADLILFARTMNFDRPALVMGAKTYDVDLSHSGRKIARKWGKGKGLSVPRIFPCAEREPGDMPLPMTREEIV